MSKPSVGIIGGTGPQGRGLGARLARAGHTVILGSRDQQRAAAAASEINEAWDCSPTLEGRGNHDAAASADIAIIAVPFDGHDELLSSLRSPLRSKIVVSCVNPLAFDRRGPVGLPVPDGSAAERAAALLPESRLVAAFHHLSAVLLQDPSQTLDNQDVLVCSDHDAARDVVVELCHGVVGKPGIRGGPLRMARQLEPLTAIIITINKEYKTHAGLAITGMAQS